MAAPDVAHLHRRACESFGARVHAVGHDQWHLDTPCEAWDVWALVNHLVSEDRWTPPLMAGSTIEEVGDRFEGDLLGDDPVRAWDQAVAEAVAAMGRAGAMARTVHLSFGETPAEEYAMQLYADHLVHSWDLAVAIGADDSLDPELVDACWAWFSSREGQYREAGVVGPPVEVPEGGDAQTVLLARFGRRRGGPRP
ncbi:MAG: TIGR03086 family metal-binding protein [Acidimicrobiales bacterium]